MTNAARTPARLALALLLAAAALFGTIRPAFAAPTPLIYVLAENNSIALLAASRAAQPFTPTAVVGLAAGDRLVALDVRPQNNRLYGLTLDDAGGLKLYHLDLASGTPVATAVSPEAQRFTDGTNPVPTPGTAFGIDFNPVVDRLRIVSNGRLNARINPNTGTLIDGDNGGAVGSALGINPDAQINGLTTTVDDTAYTNSSVNATATTQYTLDSATDRLYIQTPPNSGAQTQGRDLTLNGAPLTFTRVDGLDIPSAVEVATSNTAATGTAYAGLTVNGVAGLYLLNLADGTTSLLGTLGTANVIDIAIAVTPAAGIALTGDGTQLQRFAVARPDTVATITITGVTIGESLVGIDGRPATGQLFGLGINAATDTGTLYRIDPQTGAATAIGTPGQIAFVSATDATVDLSPPEIGYGVDFNPAVDRIRVVNGAGLNFRLNPNTGAPVDGDTGAAAGSVSGTNPDARINGLVDGVDATAYTNNFQSAPGAVPTTQYTLDSRSDQLFIQSPPNSGTQVQGRPVTLNGAPLDFGTANGFDIPANVVVTTANAPAVGRGYLAASVGGQLGLYTLDLQNGTVRPAGTLGTGSGQARGLVVWSAPPFGAINLPLVRR